MKFVFFADASHTKESTELCYIIGLVIGPVRKGSFFHLLFWPSQRCKRPAKSTRSLGTLAAGEGVDELVMIKKVLSTILKTEVVPMKIVDSKDLHHALSSKRSIVDKSVRPDLNAICFHFITNIYFLYEFEAYLMVLTLVQK